MPRYHTRTLQGKVLYDCQYSDVMGFTPQYEVYKAFNMIERKRLSCPGFPVIQFVTKTRQW